MSGPRLLVPDDEHPERIRIPKNVILLTQDMFEGPIRWSRFVQTSYKPGHGTLSSQGEIRIRFQVYLHEPESEIYEPFTDEDWIAREFNRYHVDGTLTAIHYAPGTRVMELMTQLPMDVDKNRNDACALLLPRITQRLYEI